MVLLLLACAAEEPSHDGTTVDTASETIADALGDCAGNYVAPPAYPNQLAAGEELQRYTLREPSAVCNDGTPAVMYVRGYTDEALADTWSIHLQGGGQCSGYASCVVRWCGLDYYDSSKMSSRDLPLDIAGFGIYDAEAPNVLAGANQVFFYYCSSDAWRSQGRAEYSPEGLDLVADSSVELPEELPAYRMYRRGHTILAAGLNELAEGLVADGGETLPPLQEAARVVFSGTSGGSIGARVNADFVRERLAPNGTEVVALFDAAHIPSGDLVTEPHATDLRTQKDLGWSLALETEDRLPYVDESCWQHLGGSEDEGLCFDADYLMLNHITTPFFVRQDLRDLGDAVEGVGLAESQFQEAAVQMLGSLFTIQDTAVEGDAIEVVPGAYGPNCAQHVALESTNWWAVGTVQDEAGVDWSFQHAVLAWYGGASVSVVDEPNGGSGDGPRSTCPRAEDER